MDTTKEITNENPREKANIFSIIFFTYTLGLFKKGYSKTLETVDLYKPLAKDKSTSLGDRLEKNWNAHLASIKLKNNKKPSLLKVLLKTFWMEVSSLAIIMVFLEIVIRCTQPIMLGHLLDYYRPNSHTTINQAYLYAAAVASMDLVCSILMNQLMMNAFHYGMKFRIACCTLVYRKGLRLSATALGETASGQVVNLLSNDVSRFDVVMLMAHYLWGAPVMCIIVMCILYSEVGYAGIIGMIPLFLIVPLQSYLGKLSAVYRKATAEKTDERIRITDEVISGIQVIKMYAWEIPFNKVITWARKLEIKVLTKSSYLRGIFMAFKLFTSRLALFCTILTMALNNQTVSATRVFVFTLFFHVLTQAIAGMFVRGISEIAEVLVSIDRIQKFLMNEEFTKPANQQNGLDMSKTNEDTAVIFKNVTARWVKNSDEISLRDINLKITKGKLHGIIGTVGCGKSSMLQAILGEIYITQGTLNTYGTVSYASQGPWLFSASVRQNILFGLPYDKKKYKEVVTACALLKDFEQFPDGDLTIIGDRGGSLSGGQKARVNLARAVYRDADIYLLDDPLSAVDIHVARHLYNKCINGYLANKTRILVTHQIYLLKDADHIVILHNGVIETQGNFHEIARSKNAYIKGQLTEPEEEGEDEEEDEDGYNEDAEIRELEDICENAGLSTKVSFSRESIRESSRGRSDSIAAQSDQDEQKLMPESKTMKRSISKVSRKSTDSRKSLEIRPEPIKLQEESSLGKVKGSLFWKYHLAGGNIFFCSIVLILYLLTQVFASLVDYFLSVWTNIEEAGSLETMRQNLPNWSREDCIYIYVGLIAIVFIVTLVRSFSFYKLAMIASQKMHDNLFKNVLYATMRFFDTTPSGRILNRFSKDLGSVDELLPKAILDAGQIVLQLGGSLILVAIVNPYLLALVIILCIIFWFLRLIFLKSSTNIKRLEGIMKGPVFTHMNATLQGLPTIRACGAQPILMNEFDKLQDYHTSTWFMYVAASSAFGFACDFLSSLFTGMVTFSFLLFGGSSKPGEVGLAITQAATLTGIIQWGMRQSAEIVNQLISVERIMEYDSLPKEKEPEIPSEVAVGWPDRGLISFKDMGLRYDEAEPLVLKNLTIAIQPKEKVGIVGRTGAGKSSLISALFRLANIEGEIEIDKINTGHIRLHDLRSRISIIPQDPVLFSGTLRYNLDPFEEYKDADLYKAINEVELKDPSNVINKLDYKVMDRGVNYSVGQRQLICLARAIVRNNKILMLDEATANVDPQTDALIQKTIREKFSDCTVLTVAHRLNTIMDSDKVMVMDRGSIVEFDHPHILLQNTSGVFYTMVMDTEHDVAEHLKHIAKETYLRNNIES